MTDPQPSPPQRRTEMTDHAYYHAPTTRERLEARLFPAQHVEAVYPEWAGQGDVVFVDSITHVSWLDRLRILLTGRIVTKSRVTCEHKVGRTTAVTAAWPVRR